MTRDEPVPAIVREFSDEDVDVEVCATKYDTVSFNRGIGDSGYKLEIVEHDCPYEHCSHDRMLRRWDVNPTRPDEVRYWCLSPACPYQHGGQFDYALNPVEQRSRHTEPVIFE